MLNSCNYGIWEEMYELFSVMTQTNIDRCTDAA